MNNNATRPQFNTFFEGPEGAKGKWSSPIFIMITGKIVFGSLGLGNRNRNMEMGLVFEQNIGWVTIIEQNLGWGMGFMPGPPHFRTIFLTLQGSSKQKRQNCVLTELNV